MKLGELFVDLGVNTGNALNTLSGFAFKFNQLVEAAKTVSGYLDEMFGKTSKYAYDMKILSQASGVPIKTLQAMNIAARNSNTSIQNMVGHIKKLNEGILKFRTGDGSLLSQLSPLGITSDDIMTAKNGYDLMDKVVRRIQDIPDEFIKTSFLSSFMPIEDFNAYVDMLDNKEYYEKRAENLTKQEIENLSRLYQINKEIDQKSEDRYNKFVSKTAPMMIDFKLKITDIKDEFYSAIESANSFGEAVSGAVGIATKHLGDLWKNISLNIDESGFLTEVGNNLVTVFGTVVDILIDSVRAVGHFAKVIGRLFKGDFKGAIQTGEDFFSGSKIGERYNKIVGGESVIEGKTTGKSISGVRSISDEDMARNQRIASAFFRSKGYSESSVRAWVGNLSHESWLDPSQLGDNGASFGIAQWQGSRRRNLEAFARKRGKPADDLMTQLEFLYSEIKSTPSVGVNSLNRLGTREAIERITDDFERAGVKAYSSRYQRGMSADITPLENGLSSGFSGNYTSTVNIYGVEQDRLQSVSGEAIKDSHADIIRQSNISPSGV